jgi:outer membrane usher protein FimD/PapC
VYAAVRCDFELKRTLQTGEFIFSGDILSEYNFNGIALANTIVLNKAQLGSYSTLSHEIIHVYQDYDFNVSNTYLNKPLSNLRSNFKVFDGLSN